MTERKLSCNLIVIDNFYENPYEVREFAINKFDQYKCHNYHPGKRSLSYATCKHKELFNNMVEPYFGKIILFNTSHDTSDEASYDNPNGAFQYNIGSDKTWIHVDNCNTNWGGIIYLTPDAPLSGGTGFFKHVDGNMDSFDTEKLNNNVNISKDASDITKWKLVSSVGNVFNRLILFRSNQYHASLDYFGTNINNGRLIQLFFFKTER
jgi:hypothetical protein